MPVPAESKMVAQNSLVLWAASSSDPVSLYSDTQWGFFWLLYLLINMSQSWGEKENALNSLVQSHKEVIVSFAFRSFRRCLRTKLNQKSEHFCFWNTTALNTPNPKIHLKIQEWPEEPVTNLLGHEFLAGFPGTPPNAAQAHLLWWLLSSPLQAESQAQRVLNNSSWFLLPEVSWRATGKSSLVSQGGFMHWLYNTQEGTIQPKICLCYISILPCVLSDRISLGWGRAALAGTGTWLTQQACE